MKLPNLGLPVSGWLKRRVPMAVLIIAAAVAPLWVFDFSPTSASLTAPEPPPPVPELTSLAPAVPPAPPGPVKVERTLHIGRGDTLMGIMLSAGIPRADAHGAIEALRPHFDPRRLRPDHEIVAGFERDPDDPENENFTGLTIRPDLVREYAVTRGDDGEFHATIAKKEVSRHSFRASGVIRSSLYEAAVDAGVPPAVLMELVRIYSWDVDFQRSIRPGDRFDLMYERFFTPEGKLVRNGEILYADLVLQGHDNPLYRYTTTGDVTDYFDDHGKSARKALMRTPINGARLSSGYGVRHHPILGYTKMHRGVDFAAPRGTPIYAAGDGTVVYRGRNGSYGNYVRIRHNSEYSTAYAHMRSFARKAGRGSRVRQGQIIGYVGTTGRSTGPHLHYEILRRGRQVNPMRVKMPSGETLKGKELARFQAARANVDERFAALPETAEVASGDAPPPNAQ